MSCIFGLKNSDLVDKLLEKKICIEYDCFLFLDKAMASPMMWELERLDIIKYEQDNLRTCPLDEKRYRLLSVYSEGKVVVYDGKNAKIDIRYLLASLPNEVFLEYDNYFYYLDKIKNHWKNGYICHPNTEARVYGTTECVSSNRIKPSKNKDMVDVEIYVEFGLTEERCNDVRYCSLTLPKENIVEFYDDRYYFYLTEPNYELKSIDDKTKIFPVSAEFIDSCHYLGEVIHDAMMENERKQKEKERLKNE